MSSPFFSTLCSTPEVGAMPETWGEGRTSDGNDDVGLHNITDVIFSIRYPLSATDTVEEPNFVILDETSQGGSVS